MNSKIAVAVYDNVLFVDSDDASKEDVNVIKAKAEKALKRKLILCVKPKVQWMIPALQKVLAEDIIRKAKNRP